MYMPANTRTENYDEAFALMQQNPFVTLVSVSTTGEPVISHLPLTVTRGEGNSKFILTGHCARANPQWRHLAAGPTTVIFHGAHTYISPVWYEQNDVPTWNYSVIHAIGRTELIEDYEGVRGFPPPVAAA